MVATGVVAHFVKEFKEDFDDERTESLYELGLLGRFEFFLYTSVVGIFVAVISLVQVTTGLCEKGGSLTVSPFDVSKVSGSLHLPCTTINCSI